jgi:methyl-accepting chemotaxis protein
LAKLEVEAMEAVENAGPEEWMAASHRASEILHGQSYIDAARAIQVPVGEFERLLAERLEQASLAAEDTEKIYFSLLVFVSGLSGLLVLLAVTWMSRRIGAALGGLVGNLDETSARVAGASDSIRESSLALSDGTARQAASLEETSASLEEIASMTRQNAESARRTSQTTKHTVELIDAGVKNVDRMSEAMREISESAEKIGLIIKTIEGIAFQTNLLALNAAVEAARAGEAGQGFAVVADEVRNLAQSAAGAAHDTALLIEGTVTRVRNGAEIAAALDSSFREIEAGAKEVGQLIVEISASTSEQAQKVDHVNTAVAQMDKATQSNAAGAEACASASEELASQAARLKNMVEELTRLVVGGPTAEAIPPRPSRTDRPAHLRLHDSGFCHS